MNVPPVNLNPNTTCSKSGNNNKNLSFKAININLSIFLTDLARRADCREATLTVMRIHRLDRFMSKFHVKGEYIDNQMLVSGRSMISDDDVMLIDQKIDKHTKKPLETLKFIEREYQNLLNFYHHKAQRD